MKKSIYIIGILVVAILAIVTWFGINGWGNVDETITQDMHDEHQHQSSMKSVELNKAQYENAGIELGGFVMKNLSEVVNANGYTKLPPQNQADVSVFTTGLVKSIKVFEGQEVKKGQVLATIESPEFTILQEEYLTAKSNLNYLRLEYDRQKRLSEADVNARKVLEKTRSDLEIEEARFNSLKKQLEILKISGDAETISAVPVVAPISGHITDIYVNIGSSVEIGKPLFSIVDNSEMHVDLLVYEKDLARVEEGQNVRFVLTNQSNTEINGTIFNVGKSFKNETKSVAVHAHIEDKEKSLIPGMYVNALIDVGSSEVRTLPTDAVVQAEGRNFVFVQEAPHNHGNEESGNGDHISFRRVEVSTGPSQLGFIETIPVQKIRKGEKIVIKGAYYLQSHLQKSEGGGGHHH